MEKDDAFLKKLRETFRNEAEEHLDRISSGLLELEKARSAEERSKIAEIVYREAHSLKGAARAVNMASMEALGQSLESSFGPMKRGESALDAGLFDSLHRTLDDARGLLSPSGGREERADSAPSSGGFPASPIELSDMVRISSKKLLSLVLLAEEMLSVKAEADQRGEELSELHDHAERWRRAWENVPAEARAARKALAALAERNGRTGSLSPLENILDYLTDGNERIGFLLDKVSVLLRAAERERESSERMWANLLEGARSVLLFPFSSLLEFFPRMVRDLSREQGKETELFVKGDDIEVDRRVLEKLKDPLIHMIRNGVGHGVEKPEDRARKGKPRKGRIGIEIARLEGGHVEIAVSDDGVGIDPVMVKESAVRAGAATRTDADAMSERDAVQLIFRSEVTTSEKVDGLSGRGLGLAIALDNVRKIGGDIAVESAPSIGTTFRIRVPVNLASFRGVIMRAGDRLFAVPTSAMRRVVRVDASKLQTAGNREMVEVDGEAIPLFPLAATLGLEPLRKERGAFIVAVVLEANGNAAAFDVDEVIGEQEVLVKNLGRHLARLRLVSGATILGSGHVVPILNVPDLMRAARESAPPPLGETGDMKDAREAKKSILVVEDSITSRMLLKNILESAGYRVETSVDGRDAFAKLKISAYDLVVSDVDMPRMNGFELTARIRSDEAVSDTPVVLVTALGSREDRERGIDVGANAYILKSSFDQGDLLEVVRRLA